MKKFTKYTIIISIILIITGSVTAVSAFFGGAATTVYYNGSSGFVVYTDLEKSMASETVSLDGCEKIVINGSYGNVTITEGDEYSTTLYNIYNGDIKTGYSLNKSGSTAIFTEIDNLTLYNFGIGINLNGGAENKMIITIPKDINLSELVIETDGNINISGFSSEKIDVTTSYNKAEISNITAVDFKLNAKSSSVYITNIEAEKAKLTTSYGSMSLAKSSFSTLKTNSQSDDGSYTSVHAEDFKLTLSYGTALINDCTFDNSAFALKSCDIKLKSAILDELTLDSEYSEIDIIASTLGESSYNLNCDNLRIEKIAEIKGGINLKSKYSDILIDGASTNTFNYFVTAEYGDIKIDGNEYNKSYTAENNAPYTIKADLSVGSLIVK